MSILFAARMDPISRDMPPSNVPAVWACLAVALEETMRRKKKIILIKGAYCFVFDKESDAAPKYAISLVHMKAKLQSPSHGMYHVTIEASLGDVDWELGFEQKPIAQQFVDAFRHRAAVGEADEVRKRLGHDKLAPKRGSVMYAENIAQKKLEDQPEKRENILLEDSNRADADIMMTAAY